MIRQVIFVSLYDTYPIVRSFGSRVTL